MMLDMRYCFEDHIGEQLPLLNPEWLAVNAGREDHADIACMKTAFDQSAYQKGQNTLASSGTRAVGDNNDYLLSEIDYLFEWLPVGRIGHCHENVILRNRQEIGFGRCKHLPSRGVIFELDCLLPIGQLYLGH